MRVRFIPFAVIGVLVLAPAVGGCDGGSGGDRTSPPVSVPVSVPTSAPVSAPGTGTVSRTDSGPPHPPSPTVPADVPTTGPNLVRTGEQPPVMPLAATQHTQSGALAFAKFFELTIDWGYATTSTTYMKHYFQQTCITCKSIQQGLDRAAAKHRHFIGGRMTLTSALDRGTGGPSHAERSILVEFRLTSVEVVDSSGTFVNADPALTMKDQIYLRWVGQGWTVVQIQPVS